MFSDEWYKLQDPGIHYTGMSELGDEIRKNAEKRRWELRMCRLQQGKHELGVKSKKKM